MAKRNQTNGPKAPPPETPAAEEQPAEGTLLPVKVGDHPFAIIRAANEGLDVALLLERNVGTDGLTPFDLERIRIPAGGGKAWTLGTIEGETTVPHFDAVVLFWKAIRVFWADAYSGEGTPPDCQADDGLIGVGKPGGVCRECPMAAFGSAPDGRGQACKQCRQIFVMLPDDRLPRLLSLPPTSLRNAKKFFLRLVSAGLPYDHVLTRFALEPAKSGGGIAYVKATLSMAAQLDPKVAEFFVALGKTLRPALEAVPATAADYAETPEDDSE